MIKYKTAKTDFEHLEAFLNELCVYGDEVVQILPSVEYDGTLYVIVYKEYEV